MASIICIKCHTQTNVFCKYCSACERCWHLQGCKATAQTVSGDGPYEEIGPGGGDIGGGR